MNKLSNLEPRRIFHYFEEISAIPRGSGNMEAISRYCMDFAETHGLRAIRDEANNVIIYKEASRGYEGSQPVILQGHLDMVCQKKADCTIDFERDGLTLYTEGDYIKARGTTLGADNGIAVAMILSVLESDSLAHPPLEAVFTTDEEIGMIGAGKLSPDCLKGKKMINLDAEDSDTLTVSCAGGSECKITLPLERKPARGQIIELTLQGLKGGHSGIEINSGRCNANLLAGRILNRARAACDFEIISVNGGDKTNVITPCCTIRLLVENGEDFIAKMKPCFEVIKKEIAEREPGFTVFCRMAGEGEEQVLSAAARDKLIFVLLSAPSGVLEMSAAICELVETSLNLGILKTGEACVTLQFALRSNKQSALDFLEERLTAYAAYIGCGLEISGHYPPWEFKEDSRLQELYTQVFQEKFGRAPVVTAIHAGLECGVFASGLPGLDCIAIGPKIEAAHTTDERLSISSAKETYELLLELLARCK